MFGLMQCIVGLIFIGFIFLFVVFLSLVYLFIWLSKRFKKHYLSYEKDDLDD